MFSRILQKDNVAWAYFFENAHPHIQTVNEHQQVVNILKNKDELVKRTQNYMMKLATSDVNATELKGFTHVLKHLRNSKTVRKNVDQRLFWILNDIILCKKYFTLGVLNAEDGMAYIITTGKVEMDIYLTDYTFDNYYLPESSMFFTKDVLLAEECYILTKSFILVASKHCLFKIRYEPLNGRNLSHPPSCPSIKVVSDPVDKMYSDMPIIL